MASAVPSATRNSLGTGADHLDEEVRRLERHRVDQIDGPGAGVAVRQPGAPALVAAALPVVADHEDLEIGPQREGLAGHGGPTEHRDRVVGGEGQQPRQAVGGVVVADEGLGVPGRLGRLGPAQHPRGRATTGVRVRDGGGAADGT